MVSVHSPGWLHTFGLLALSFVYMIRARVTKADTVVLNSSSKTPSPKIGSNTLTTEIWLSLPPYGPSFPPTQQARFGSGPPKRHIYAKLINGLRIVLSLHPESTICRFFPDPTPHSLGLFILAADASGAEELSVTPRLLGSHVRTGTAVQRHAFQALPESASGLGRVRAHTHCRTESGSLGGHGLDLRQHWEG